MGSTTQVGASVNSCEGCWYLQERPPLPLSSREEEEFMAINTSQKTKHQTRLQNKYGVKSHAMACFVAGKPREFRSEFLVSRLSVTDGSVTPPCWQFLQPPRETRVHTSCRKLTQVLSHTSSAPLKFNYIAPEQWWLEDSPLLFWKVCFSGVTSNSGIKRSLWITSFRCEISLHLPPLARP